MKWKNKWPIEDLHYLKKMVNGHKSENNLNLAIIFFPLNMDKLFYIFFFKLFLD